MLELQKNPEIEYDHVLERKFLMTQKIKEPNVILTFLRYISEVCS